MNKTVTVNIGGIVFHIDENAYEKFRAYLESIRSHFTAAEGRDEIMQDIESRIAEMFQEKLGDTRQVITLDDVEQVTSQMGKPEQITEESDFLNADTPYQQSAPGVKKLFRNPDDKILGGVASGVAAYYDYDVSWVRIAYALITLFFMAFVGSGFFFIMLYIILWIVLPEAKTTIDKLQMRGEPITVSNIEKNRKEEKVYEKAFAEDAKSVKKKGTAMGRIFEGIGKAIKIIFLILGKLVAVFFIFIGLVVAFAMLMGILALIGIPGTQYPEVWRLVFDSSQQFFVASFAALLLIGIPFLMLAYAGVRILFDYHKGQRIIGFTAMGLWLVGLGVSLFIGMRVLSNFSEKDQVRTTYTMEEMKSNKLIVEMHHDKNKEKNYFGPRIGFDLEDDFYLEASDGIVRSGNVKVDFVKSESDSFEVVQLLYARGKTRKDAVDNASGISYKFAHKDSVLTLDRFFTFTDPKYRSQKVQVLIKIPVGSSVYMDPSLKRFIYDIDNVQNVLDNDMLGKTWIMTKKGLSCMDCDGTERVVGGGKIHIDTGEDGTEIRIDKKGLRITGPDGEKVRIDSSGVIIKRKGEKEYRITGDNEVRI
ncbi:MAG: PspC domain-containing protein [Bacteroidetes bacterium]|nr:MAG: PspC domain-containing protein [Bacteroidota bacterium]REJ99734.1 MAG: PspC domain-containing protein [Bacteroidota bacterium]REK32928.1 MAG: PspC domain-containing protein [Bacteroidota bacterium]REK47733.1 MAG: PspC domain-containing protein [Bacteroidota bacterium]